MKVYKVEIMVIDFDEIGEESIRYTLENARYPNHCIAPQVKTIESRDIGEWHDEHPLNKQVTADETYKGLFKQ